MCALSKKPKIYDKRTNVHKKLKKDADTYFSLYIRYRDGKKLYNEDTGEDEWWTVCITCGDWKPLKKMHAGHFQSRRYMATRYDEFNVNGQCPKCNTFNAGEQYLYSKAIDKKFGKGIAEQLEKIARKTKRMTTEEFISIIEDAKQQIAIFEGA